jgi:hypothetical protein
MFIPVFKNRRAVAHVSICLASWQKNVIIKACTRISHCLCPSIPQQFRPRGLQTSSVIASNRFVSVPLARIAPQDFPSRTVSLLSSYLMSYFGLQRLLDTRVESTIVLTIPMAWRHRALCFEKYRYTSQSSTPDQSLGPSACKRYAAHPYHSATAAACMLVRIYR